MKRLLLSLLTAVYICAAYGKEKLFPVMHFDQFNGLDAQTVYNIRTDRDGFLWLASKSGLFRFDGKKFYRYTTQDGLCDSEIIEVMPDSNGNVWCSGYNGKISLIRNGVVDTGARFIREWHSEGIVIDLAPDQQGNVYLASEPTGLFCIDTAGRITRLQLPKTKNSIISIIWHDRALWVITSNTVFRYHPQSGFKEMAFPGYIIRRNTAFTSEQYGGLWAFSKYGYLCNLFRSDSLNIDVLNKRKVTDVQVSAHFILVSYEGDEYLLYNLRDKNYKQIELPKGTRVADITEDHSGHVWISTLHNGLFAVLTKQRMYPDKATLFALPNMMGAYKNSHELITVSNNLEIRRVAGKRVQVLQPAGRDNKVKTPIEYVSFREGGPELFMITEAGMVRLGTETARLDKRVYGKEIEIYGDSLLFLRTSAAVQRRSLARPDTFSNVFTGRSFGIGRQKDQLWIASKDGLYNYNILSGRLQRNICNIPGNGRIENITPWGDDILLLGTSNSGMLFWQHGRVRYRITTAEGLFDDDCKEVDACLQGWVVRHPMGLSYISHNGRIAHASECHGIPVSAVNNIHVCKDTLWMATTHGLVVSDLQSLFQVTEEKRKVTLLRISSGGKVLSPDGLVLEPAGNKLRVDYAIPEYDQPQLVQYAWSLDGDNWNKTYSTSLDLADLRPGKYQLRFTAKAPGYTRTSVTVLSFVVGTPFWKTTLFICAITGLVVLIAWFLLYRYYRRQLLRHREKAAVQHQLLSYEQKALNAMMNPHFVFNAMASIQYLLNNGDIENANRYLVKFSRLIRSSLELMQADVSLLRDEIERLTLYLQLEQMRLDGKMDFEITIDKTLEADRITIPSMILQTYAENAVVHGASGSEKELLIRISFLQKNDCLQIQIEDNGPGLPPDYADRRSSRFGLAATQKRLELLEQITGKSYRVEITSPGTNAAGTCVMLFFPLVALHKKAGAS